MKQREQKIAEANKDYDAIAQNDNEIVKTGGKGSLKVTAPNMLQVPQVS